MSLDSVNQAIICCARCPRLRTYCREVAREKKSAYRDELYWGRPVPGFGDAHASLLIVGLAPAAHGANRTGRVFTGDGSGDFLMSALHASGFASLPTSRHPNDGLRLSDAYVAAAIRCAPPKNKPLPAELAACRPYLEAELAQLQRVKVIVALGAIAFDACWRILQRNRPCRWPKPRFGHGLVYEADSDSPVLIASYHPSRQNTNTGKLTAAMLEEIFAKAKSHLNTTT